LWTVPVPIAAAESASIAMGDALGGVLLNVTNSLNGLSVVRIGDNGTNAWRHDSAEAKGQAGEGTIYALESADNDQWLVVLDGETGMERARVLMARSTELIIDPRIPGLESRAAWTGGFTKLVIDGHGDARVLVTSGDLKARRALFDEPVAPTPSGPSARGAEDSGFGLDEWTTRLELWTVTPDGNVTRTVLATDTVTADARTAKTYGAGILVPDDDNIALVTWGEQWADTTGGSPEYHHDRHFARVSTGGGVTVLPLSEDVSAATAAMGEQNTLFVSDGYTVSAVDATDGTVRWSAAGVEIVGTTAGGGVVVRSFNGLDYLDSYGVIQETSAVSGPGSPSRAGWLSTSSSSIGVTIASWIDWAAKGFNRVFGNSMGTNSSANCQPPQLPGLVGVPPIRYTYEFSTFTTEFSETVQSRVNQAASAWVQAGYVKLQKRVPSQAAENNIVIMWHSYFNAKSAKNNGPGGPIGRALFPFDLGSVYNDNWLREERLNWVPLVPLTDFAMQLDSELKLPDVYNPTEMYFVPLHEFGHFVGLDHPPDSCNSQTSVMTWIHGFGLGMDVLTPLDRKALLARLAMRAW
jgi:Matrixin